MDAKLDGGEMKRTRHITSRRLPERPHGQAGIDQDNTEQQEIPTSIYRLWTPRRYGSSNWGEKKIK